MVVIDQRGSMIRAKLVKPGEKYPDVSELTPLKAFRNVSAEFFLEATEAAERMQQGRNISDELRKLDELLKEVK